MSIKKLAPGHRRDQPEACNGHQAVELLNILAAYEEK